MHSDTISGIVLVTMVMETVANRHTYTRYNNNAKTTEL